MSDGTKHDWLPADGEILSQPLTTEDGFINEACLNELEAATRRSLEMTSKERHTGNIEWTRLGVTMDTDIVGALACAIVRCAGGVPPGLEDFLIYVRTHARERLSLRAEQGFYIGSVALWQIDDLIEELIEEHGIMSIWNDSEIMSPKGLTWISCGVLGRNTAVAVRNARRHDAAFDRRFERDYAERVGDE